MLQFLFPFSLSPPIFFVSVLRSWCRARWCPCIIRFLPAIARPSVGQKEKCRLLWSRCWIPLHHHHPSLPFPSLPFHAAFRSLFHAHANIMFRRK
uniref:Putative secreted protein n=1 Tax=Anopheles darlingi TaxID=43151 RepID=A0A2M4D6E8_ANODA